MLSVFKELALQLTPATAIMAASAADELSLSYFIRYSK
jgi:hypothetical protein